MGWDYDAFEPRRGRGCGVVEEVVVRITGVVSSDVGDGGVDEILVFGAVGRIKEKGDCFMTLNDPGREDITMTSAFSKVGRGLTVVGWCSGRPPCGIPHTAGGTSATILVGLKMGGRDS